MKTANDSASLPHPDLFESIPRESSLVSRVAQQLEDLISAGRLRPGDLLPPENELARQLGVSRTVVREAVRGLMAKDLLQARSGSGTIINAPNGKFVAQSMTLLLRAGAAEFDVEKVLQVRRLLEVEISGLAALRRTAEDMELLADSLHQLERAHDRETFAKIDVDFHAALAQATHNELFTILLDSISDVMLETRRTGYDVPGTPERGLKYHRAIFDQIKAGDPAEARRAMREHLAEGEETLRKALGLPTDSIDNSH